MIFMAGALIFASAIAGYAYLVTVGHPIMAFIPLFALAMVNMKK